MLSVMWWKPRVEAHPPAAESSPINYSNICVAVLVSISASVR